MAVIKTNRQHKTRGPIISLLTVKLRNWGPRTRIIICTKTNAPVRRCTVRCSALVTSQFCSRWFAGRQMEKISGIGRIAKVAVEPPLVKGIVGEGCHRPIVVWEGFE